MKAKGWRSEGWRGVKEKGWSEVKEAKRWRVTNDLPFSFFRQKCDFDSYAEEFRPFPHHLFFAFGNNQFYIISVLLNGQTLMNSKDVCLPLLLRHFISFAFTPSPPYLHLFCFLRLLYSSFSFFAPSPLSPSFTSFILLLLRALITTYLGMDAPPNSTKSSRKPNKDEKLVIPPLSQIRHQNHQKCFEWPKGWHC